jgi:predicted AlkP superfamily pyrophosphatase or phosphodiesterase
MKKTVVLNVVGLTQGLIHEKNTPFLSKWSKEAKINSINPVLPAVTCATQATYVTGKMPNEHGIVGNGWYFKDECEIKFWKQSNKLIQGEKIWDVARKLDPTFTCSNMFWWYNMYSTADYSVTPRPNYLADGRKTPDCYSHPADLRDQLQAKFGDFPLFTFWGPNTNIKSTRWIAEASMFTDNLYDPTLTFIYLPHLDYNLQRYGQDHKSIPKDLKDIDGICVDLIKFYEGKGAQVIILSEYGITKVSKPIHINRVLRKKDLLAIRQEQGWDLLDAGASKAFAVSDHQIAHIYVNDKKELKNVRELLENTEGIELILDENTKSDYNIDHERSGDFVVVADKDSWFTYYFWLDDDKAPDYARMVDIHKKPGYDPVEMFLDPKIKIPAFTVGSKLIKKQMGFRTVMDVIPLDATLVGGSHGRISEHVNDRPLIITKQKDLLPAVEGEESLSPTVVFDIILSHLQNNG